MLVQDKAEKRSHTVCMASDDNDVLRQQAKPTFKSFVKN